NPSNDFLPFYKKLIAARLRSPELQSGDPVALRANDDQGTAAYARVLDGKAAIVALNRSDSPRTLSCRLPKDVQQKSFTDALRGKTYTVSAGAVSVQLPPKSAVVLISSSHHSS